MKLEGQCAADAAAAVAVDEEELDLKRKAYELKNDTANTQRSQLASSP